MEDPEFAITQLAQTTMRSELGKMTLDKVFRERESLNVSIVDSINKASEAWGISCLRYEIRDIKVTIIFFLIGNFISYNLISSYPHEFMKLCKCKLKPKGENVLPF